MKNISKKQNSSDRELLNHKNENIRQKNYSNQAAADFLNTSTVSLWRARKKNLITFRRIMGKILYTEADLLDYLERSKRGFGRKTEDI
jgi:hypothetical protein